jgi:hypothetical protein
MVTMKSFRLSPQSVRASLGGLDLPRRSQTSTTTTSPRQLEGRRMRAKAASDRVMQFLRHRTRGTLSPGISCVHSLVVRCALLTSFSLASIAGTAILDPAFTPVANLTSAVPRAENSPIPSSPTASQPSSTNTPTELQQLQIRQLRQQTDQWATVRAWLPAGTALVALLGAAIGVLTYFADARKERRLRLEGKIEENVGVLIDYPADDTSGIGKLNNALRNLQALRRVTGRSARFDIDRRVSHAIAEIVSYDLNLSDMRQARFDALALDNWAAYRRLLRENDELRDDIFYRYVTALRTARIAEPGLYQRVRIGPDGNYQFSKDVTDATLQHFGTLVASYRRHVTFAANDDERQRRIAAFGAALENQELAEQVFSSSSTQADGRT